jgi:hypothetical protein
MGIRSGVIVTDGPDATATAELKPGDKVAFTFQFVEGGPLSEVTVTIVTIRRIRKITELAYKIIYVVSSETRAMVYNPVKKRVSLCRLSPYYFPSAAALFSGCGGRKAPSWLVLCSYTFVL